MAKRISLLLVMASFLAMAAAPCPAISLSYDPSFQWGLVDHGPSMNWMPGNWDSQVNRSFHLGISYDPLMRSMAIAGTKPGLHHGVPVLCLPSAMLEFVRIAGGFGGPDFHHAPLWHGYVIPIRHMRTAHGGSSPVPEPATMLLLGAGLLGLAGLAKRKTVKT